jgi:hypothetical protein
MKRIIFFVISLLVLLAFSQDAQTQAYKYVDENGVTHFTEDFGTIPQEYRNQVKKQDWWEEKAAQSIEESQEEISDKTEKSREFHDLCEERNHHLAMARKTFPDERNISKAWSMYYERYLTEEDRRRIPLSISTETDPCRKKSSAGISKVPRTVVTQPRAQGPSSYSPEIGPARTKIIRSDRDVRYNPLINPKLNASINPQANLSINPRNNFSINPTYNSLINPKLNASINPSMNLSLNPMSNILLNPTKSSFSGLSVFDLDGNVAGVAVPANTSFLVYFNAQGIWVGYFCSNNAGGYNWFSVDGNWLGFLISNSANGFNLFLKDGQWMGYLN